MMPNTHQVSAEQRNREDLRNAAAAGQTERVKTLIGKATTSDIGLALHIAADNNNLACVRLLQPHAGKHALPYALRWACDKGHSECAQFLLQFTDDETGEALAYAVYKKQWACVELLWKFSNTDNALAFLRRQRYPQECTDIVVRMNAEKQAQMIAKHLPDRQVREQRKM